MFEWRVDCSWMLQFTGENVRRHFSQSRFIFIIVCYFLPYSPPMRRRRRPEKATHKKRNLIRMSLDFIFPVLNGIHIIYIIFYTLVQCVCTALIVCHSQKWSSVLWMHMLWKFKMIHTRSLWMWMCLPVNVWMQHADADGIIFSSEPPNINRRSCSMQNGTRTHTHNR